MKLKNLVGQRFKERPADCVIDSHALMIRSGNSEWQSKRACPCCGKQSLSVRRGGKGNCGCGLAWSAYPCYSEST